LAGKNGMFLLRRCLGQAKSFIEKIGIDQITCGQPKLRVMQTKFNELTDSQWEIIEKYVSHHKPREHCLRTIVNAILWICRNGSQWLNMESKYPKWQSVYYYFDIWNKNGTWDKMLNELVIREKKRQGREAEPSAVAIDSQSIKGVAFISEESRGVDGGKKVKGRKRHIVVGLLRWAF
jgi:putative transposase